MERAIDTRHRGWKGKFRIQLLVCLAMGMVFLTAAGQKPKPAPSPSPTPPAQVSTGSSPSLLDLEYSTTDLTADQMAELRRRRMLAKFAAERQKKVVADTEKLLSLTQELKSEFDGQDFSKVTVTEVKKIEAIEKLAKRVKQNLAPE